MISVFISSEKLLDELEFFQRKSCWGSHAAHLRTWSSLPGGALCCSSVVVRSKDGSCVRFPRLSVLKSVMCFGSG